MSKKFKAIKKKVMLKTKHKLVRGFISTLDGRMLVPGDSLTADDLTPERFKELKEKGLIKGTLTTEEKGTITK